MLFGRGHCWGTHTVCTGKVGALGVWGQCEGEVTQRCHDVVLLPVYMPGVMCIDEGGGGGGVRGKGGGGGGGRPS